LVITHVSHCHSLRSHTAVVQQYYPANTNTGLYL
jgi:hypothetical protein